MDVNAQLASFSEERDIAEENRRAKENPTYKVPSSGSGFVSTPNSKTMFIQAPPSESSGRLRSSIPAVGDSPATLTYQSMLADMKRIEAEQDPEKRLMAVSLLKGSIEGTIATTAGILQSNANAQYGVQDLEASLQQNLASDRADPKYHLFLSDSPATVKVREQLNQARTQARIAATDMISQSPELAAMNGAMGVFLQKETSIAMKLFNEQGKQKDKAEMAMEKAGVRGIAVGKLFNPGYTDQQAAIYAVSNSTDKNFQAVVDNIDNPEALKELAVSGVAQARTALIEKHAGIVAPNSLEGKHRAKMKAETELKALDYFTNNPTGRDKIISLFSTDPDKNKKLKESIEAKLMLAPTNAARGETERLIYGELAKAQIAQANAKEFQDNITTWSPKAMGIIENSPSLKRIVDSLRPHGVVGLDKILASISQMASKEEKSKALNELLLSVKEGAGEANKGIFGNVGSELQFTGKIQAMVAGASLGPSGSTSSGKSIVDFMGTGVNILGDIVREGLYRPALTLGAVPGAALSTPVGTGYLGKVDRRAAQLATDVIGESRILGDPNK